LDLPFTSFLHSGKSSHRLKKFKEKSFQAFLPSFCDVIFDINIMLYPFFSLLVKKFRPGKDLVLTKSSNVGPHPQRPRQSEKPDPYQSQMADSDPGSAFKSKMEDLAWTHTNGGVEALNGGVYALNGGV
jgi:hypothetical protein